MLRNKTEKYWLKQFSSRIGAHVSMLCLSYFILFIHWKSLNMHIRCETINRKQQYISFLLHSTCMRGLCNRHFQFSAKNRNQYEILVPLGFLSTSPNKWLHIRRLTRWCVWDVDGIREQVVSLLAKTNRPERLLRNRQNILNLTVSTAHIQPTTTTTQPYQIALIFKYLSVFSSQHQLHSLLRYIAKEGKKKNDVARWKRITKERERNVKNTK